jgi:hypothetical protein
MAEGEQSLDPISWGAIGTPTSALDAESADAKALYARALVLVRPDQHIAWRGDTEPAACVDLIDHVRGASSLIPYGRAA